MKQITSNTKFIAFITAGDPNLEQTEKNILALEKGDVDLIEIGIPFSDPIAEGNIIKEADIRSLSSGTTIDKIFDMIKRLRKKSSIPLAFMSYLNPIFAYGYDNFFKKCEQHQVEAVIIPDIAYEQSEEIRSKSRLYDIKFISMIAPTTSKERVKKISESAEGFIYLVSSMGVTGMRSKFSNSLEQTIQEIRKYTNIPIAVGFGIHSAEQVKKIIKIADAVIIGSKIVDLAYRSDHPEEALMQFAQEIKKAINSLT